MKNSEIRRRQIENGFPPSTDAALAIYRQRDYVKKATAYAKAAAADEGLAIRENRIKELQDHYDRCKQIMDERSIDPSISHFPGATTGLVIGKKRGLGQGANFQIIEESFTDHELVALMASLSKQIAIEKGDWSEKREFGGIDGKPITITAVEAIMPEAGIMSSGTESEG
jgi:hypothetical protein